MRTRRRRAAVVGLLGFIALYALAIGVGEAGTIRHDLTGTARGILDDAHVANGIVTFSGREGTLTDGGPVSDDLLRRLRHTWGIRRFTVTGAPSTTAASTTTTTTTTTTTKVPTTTSISAAPATTTTPTTVVSTTTTATATTAATVPAAVVNATATKSAAGIALTGVVLSEAERKTLVDAAGAAVGPAHVTDQLTIAAASTTNTDTYVAALGTLLGRFGTDLSAGSASLKDTVLTISGSAANLAADASLTGALDAATKAGLTVKGSFDVPTGSAEAVAGIQFAPDSATIAPASLAVLDQVVVTLLAKPTIKVEVDGHTDNQGLASANLVLSQQRAEAVVAYLASKGVSSTRLSAKGFGQTKPVADNATADGRQKNRRIEFTVIGG